MNTDQFPESDSLSMPNDDLRIEFDAADLSVMVELDDEMCSTFSDALEYGNVEGASLTHRQYSWLQAQQDYVEQWLAYWTERKKTPVTHTPGPWSVDPEGTYVNCIEGPSGTVLCVVHNIETAEGQANARLIAAAPELLAALEDIVRQCTLRDGRQTLGAALAQAAINKAKGTT